MSLKLAHRRVLVRSVVLVLLYVSYYIICALNTTYILNLTDLSTREWLTSQTPLHDKRGDTLFVTATTEEASSDWLVFLRIPRTGSSFLSSRFEYPNRFGHGCGWSQCRCQHAIPSLSVAAHGGSKKCSDMECFKECAKDGRRSWTLDPPHADYLEILSALARARIKRSNVYMFTVIRDPVERFLSEFRYVKEKFCKDGVIRAWDYVIEGCDSITIERFSQSPEALRMVHNRQTKMLAGVGDFSWEEMYSNENELLRAAKRNLKSMSFFLVHERMADNLEIMESCKKFFGGTFRASEGIERRSTKSLHTELSPNTRTSITALNKLDVELVRYANEMFSELLSHTRSLGCPAHARIALTNKTDIFAISDAMNPSEVAITSKVDVQIGEMFSAEFLTSFPECVFPQTAQHHVGTFSWYNNLFGCAFEWDWYRSAVWRTKSGMTIEGRVFNPHTSRVLHENGYILIIGAAQTMGIQSMYPFAHHLEHATDYPVVTLGWGGNGARFFVDLLSLANSTTTTAIKQLIHNAKVIIVQSMSGRSEHTLSCEVQCGNMYCKNGENLAALLDGLDAKQKRQAIAESRKNWLESHVQLFNMIAEVHNYSSLKLTGLLYISSTDIDVKDVDIFPQYVDTESLKDLESHVARMPNSFTVRATLPQSIHDDVRIKFPSLCNADCPPSGLESEKRCRMENIPDSCGCEWLNVNYYPSERLHLKSGHMVTNAILDKLPYVRKLWSSEAQRQKIEKQFLIFQSKGHVNMTSRNPVILLDSLCFHHRDIQIYLFVLKGAATVDDGVLNAFTKNGCRLRIVDVDLLSLVRGTPLQSWSMSKAAVFESGPHWYSHITDLFRLVMPWKYGGCYIDTDFLIVKPVHTELNYLVWEVDNHTINNALSCFEKGHPFLEFAMKRAVHTYDPGKWGSLGPLLITNAYEAWKRVCRPPNCVQVHRSREAFGITWQEANDLFNSSIANSPYGTTEGVRAIHYFNKVSSKAVLKKDSVLFQRFLEHCVICPHGLLGD